MTARRIALSLGAVAIVAASALPGRALADGPPSPSSSVSDPAGDNVPQADPRGDLTSASIAYPSGQGVVVEATVRQFEDPNAHDWKDLGSELDWQFDVDGDGRADYVARYFNAHGQPGAQMFTAGHPSVRCYGSEYADASSGTYGAAFRPECIRTPKAVTYWARLVYRTDSGSSTDETAHGGPVDNPNGVGPNPRPAFTPGDVAEFPAKVPVALTTTPDDAIWYGSAGNPTGAGTFTGNPALIRVAQDGTSSDYALPTDSFGGISAIAGANDGTVWFARSGGACYGNACSDAKPAVGRLRPGGGVDQYPLPGVDRARITTMASGPGGMWFGYNDAQDRAAAYGRVTPSGAVTLYPLDQWTGGPIATGPDGMAWMAYQHGDSGGGYFLAVIGRDGTVTRRISVPQVLAMASGADGNLWFVGRSQLGRVTPAGAVTLYPFQPEPEIEPCCTASMTRAPDGNVWFTADEFTAGRVTPRGEIILANTPGAVSLGGSGPAAITAGRCTIWFTELGTLARVRVSACSSAPPARVPTGVVTATPATSPPTSAAPGVVDTVPPQPGLPAGQAARPTKRVPTTGLPLAATIAAVTALAAAVALTGRRLLLARRSTVSS